VTAPDHGNHQDQPTGGELPDPDALTWHEATLVRIFDAPRELVWRAWTEPEQLAAWWGPQGMNTPVESLEMDLRPGGAFRLTMVAANGAQFRSEMRYHEVVPPERLVFGWDAQQGIGAGTVTVTMVDLGGRTELTNHFAGYSNRKIMLGARTGTNQQLDKLTRHLSATTAGQRYESATGADEPQQSATGAGETTKEF
jgi:uncharacterized protein YndB with AHSA1/START domain